MADATAVLVSVKELARTFAAARRDLAGKKDSLRTYERAEWTRAELEAWLAVQAFEGMLRAVEQTPRRNVRSPQSIRLLVRGRSGARLSSSAVGASLLKAAILYI